VLAGQLPHAVAAGVPPKMASSVSGIVSEIGPPVLTLSRIMPPGLGERQAALFERQYGL
jgi:hypothetical protein